MANTKTNKMTKAVAFTLALEALNASNLPNKAEAMEKISKEIENISKKSSGSGKPTAKQIANAGLGETVVEFLREHPTQMFTISELMKQVQGLPADISNQKMTSIFRLDSVKPHYRREMVKGKAYFQYVEAVEMEEEDE